MKRILETGLMVVAAAGFFGFIYPELCLIEDTCKVVEEQDIEREIDDGDTERNDQRTTGSDVERNDQRTKDGDVERNSHRIADSEITLNDRGNADSGTILGARDFLREISSLPPERIRIKSRLLQYLLKGNE